MSKADSSKIRELVVYSAGGIWLLPLLWRWAGCVAMASAKCAVGETLSGLPCGGDS